MSVAVPCMHTCMHACIRCLSRASESAYRPRCARQPRFLRAIYNRTGFNASRVGRPRTKKHPVVVDARRNAVRQSSSEEGSRRKGRRYATFANVSLISRLSTRTEYSLERFFGAPDVDTTLGTFLRWPCVAPLDSN